MTPCDNPTCRLELSRDGISVVLEIPGLVRRRFCDLDCAQSWFILRRLVNAELGLPGILEGYGVAVPFDNRAALATDEWLKAR
jgi:hypothetical protein